jgi:hypothetical protein
MRLFNNAIGIFAPWGDGIGTLGIKLGRFYADIFWSNWPMKEVDEEGVVESTYTWRDYLPSGIYLRAPWFIVGDNLFGGGQYYLWFRRFWRGFQRKKGT